MEFKETNVKEDKEGKKVVTVKCVDDDIYIKDCPIEKKQQKELTAYDKEYMDKVSDSLIKEAEKQFDKDKNVTKITVKAPYGFEKGGYVAAVVDREKTFKNPRDNKEITKSKVKFVVRQPSTSITKNKCRNYEDQLTKKFC